MPLCNVKDFGARGDGTGRDTRAIQEALDRCARGEAVILEDCTDRRHPLPPHLPPNPDTP